MDEKEKKIGITTGLVLLSLGLLFAATAQSGGSDGYELSVDTLPPDEVQSTEANFTANVTGLADEYDAALVYWNYSKDSSLDKKGPVDIAFSEGEKVESLESSLDPNANYNVEAYVEPIVWSDESLSESALNTTKIRENKFFNGLKSRTEAISSNVSSSIIFSDSEISSNFWNSSLSPRPPHEYSGTNAKLNLVDNPSGGKAMEIDIDSETDKSTSAATLSLNLTDFDTLKLDQYRDSQRGHLDIIIDGKVVFNTEETGWNTREINISSYEGLKDIKFQVTESGGSVHRSHIDRISNISLYREY